jgi:hypothetical protein
VFSQVQKTKEWFEVSTTPIVGEKVRQSKVSKAVSIARQAY